MHVRCLLYKLIPTVTAFVLNGVGAQYFERPITD